MQQPLTFLATESASFARPVIDYVRVQQSSRRSTQQESDEWLKRLDADLKKLDGLRRDCRTPDSHSNTAQLLIRYIAALSGLGAKLPVDESHARVPFPWSSGFTGRGFKSKSTTFFNLSGELACMMYNLGVVYHNIGVEMLAKHAASNRATLIKQAAQFFQQAAGLFKKIQDDFGAIISQNALPELSSQHVSTLVNLNLAAAQECFYVKSCDEQQRDGKMKDSTISKIAAGCADLLKIAIESLSSDSSIKTSYQKHGWLSTLQAKASFFSAAAEFRKSKEALGMCKYGEEVARLRIADACLKSSANPSQDIKSLHLEVSSRLKQAEKENDVVYLDPVPGNVSPPEKAVLVQCILPTLAAADDLFTMLYPPAVLDYQSKYDAEKGKIVESIFKGIEYCRSTLDKCMADTGLPGAVQAVEQPQGLPNELLQKSEEIRKLGGVQSVTENRQSLRVLAQDAAASLEKIETALSQELNEDIQCRNQFQDRWTRAPSSLLQQNFREQLAKHKETFRLAMAGDKVIDQKLDKSLHYIAALSSGKADLEAMIPSCPSAQQSFTSDTIASLKTLLKNSEIIRNELNRLSNELKAISNKDDIGSQLMAAFGAGGNRNLDPVISEQLKKYDVFKQRQELLQSELLPLLDNIQSVNQLFRHELAGTTFHRDREIAIQGLSEGYTTFKSLQENFSEGINFYVNFKRIVQQLQSVTDDYCFARSTEKRDLLQDFALAAANAPALPPRP